MNNCQTCETKISLDCPRLLPLLSLLNTLNQLCRYHSTNIENIIEKINIDHMVDGFLHLINQHNTDTDVEFVFNKLQTCDVTKCLLFKYRNKMHALQSKEMKFSQIRNVAYYQILATIHCYYQHAFTVGNRLAKSDMIMLETKNNKHMDPCCLVNTRLLQMNKLLTLRRQQHLKHIQNVLKQRNYKKYNSLLQHYNQEEDSTYSFGIEFKYGYHSEYPYEYQDGVSVSAKYKSLKEELVSNAIATISQKQFNNEYHKCNIYFKSDYCKQTFQPKIICHWKADIEWIFHIEYLFSLMIYCNYSELQYKFSKTYRENNGKDHNNFYHLGKYLKIAIKRFGKRICDGEVSNFYHGIGQQLILPRYIGNNGWGVYIHCPLSTSSSLSVATNFTNNNQGLIVQFGPANYKYTKYMSVAFLSDYPEELEHLFIQNNDEYETLEVVNIFDVQCGYEYKSILSVLKIINGLLTHNPLSISMHINQYDELSFHGISSGSQRLMKQIISHRLSLESECIRFSKYAKRLIKTYFHNKTEIKINYGMIKYCNHKDSFLLDLLFDFKYKFIKLKKIVALFENIRIIQVYNVKLCSFTIDNILEYLSTVESSCTINRIDFKWISKDSELTIKDALCQYRKAFTPIGYDIIYHDSLCIEKIE
eukprot:440228_1